MDVQISRRAQRIHTAILQALAKISQARVAELIGAAPSTVTLFKDEQLARFTQVLAACGLKVVPDTEESVDMNEVRALRVIARARIQDQIDQPDSGFGSL